MMRYRDQYRHYIHYGYAKNIKKTNAYQKAEIFFCQIFISFRFIAALVIGGIIGFIAGLFLLGLFFGCCGRRPNDYDYDCCVFSTASKLFNFGSWLCLLFLLVFGIVTATLMFVGANLNWLACQPMRDPLSRPDILSVGEKTCGKLKI
jgi:hypothetical protein